MQNNSERKSTKYWLQNMDVISIAYIFLKKIISIGSVNPSRQLFLRSRLPWNTGQIWNYQCYYWITCQTCVWHCQSRTQDTVYYLTSNVRPLVTQMLLLKYEQVFFSDGNFSFDGVKHKHMITKYTEIHIQYEVQTICM